MIDENRYNYIHDNLSFSLDLTANLYMYVPALWSVLTISISSNKTALISAVWACRFLTFKSQSEKKMQRLY